MSREQPPAKSATFNTAGIRDSTDYGPFVTRAERCQIFCSFDKHMLLYPTWILCSLSLQSEIERKFLKFVILYFQMWLKDQTLVHHSEQIKMIAFTRCSCSKIFIIKSVVKQDTSIIIFNQPFLWGFLQQRNRGDGKPIQEYVWKIRYKRQILKGKLLIEQRWV